MRDLPAGRVTLLFTDVEGSTQLLKRLGEAYTSALAQHRRALRAAVRRHGGVEVDTQGDACFFAFHSATEAVAAAAEAQDALKDGPIRVRMGLHCGEPAVTDEGYVGIDIHLGARIAAVAHGGQVVMSRSVATQVGEMLRDLGEHRVKDFDDPAWLFQLGEREFPPLRTLATTNLPRPASPLVGRRAAVAELVDLLHSGIRLLTLTGTGGTGKTRLAIEVACEVMPQFLHGVYWVPFAPIDDPTMVIETIARVVGAQGDLARHFEQKHALLLLDNLEHLTDAAPALADLVEQTQELAILVTSRETLRVRGEVEYIVPELENRDAVSLFCDRARLRPDEQIGRICRRLDNLPLAVELAAARAKLFSTAQILEQLSERLDFRSRARDVHPRQQTLRATIEWSHMLLAPEEKTLFARLSVFRGGCTFAAAEAACGATGETLAGLIDKSLLRRRDDDTEPRFSMLETVREFAAEELSSSSDARDVALKVALYMRVFVQEQVGALWEQAGVRRALTTELPNLMAAIEWSYEAAERDLFLELVTACSELWVLLGHARPGRRWIDIALAMSEVPAPTRGRLLMIGATLATHDGDLETARRFADEAVAIAEQTGDGELHVLAANQLANALAGLDELPAALKLYRRTRHLSRAMEDRRGEAMALVNVAAILNSQGAFQAARRSASTSLILFRQRNNIPGIGAALLAIAQAAIGDGEVVVARESLAESSRIFLEAGHSQWLARCLEGFAGLRALEGSHPSAASLLGTAEAARDQVGAAPTYADRAFVARTSASIARHLPADIAAAARQHGRSIPPKDAIEEALALL